MDHETDEAEPVRPEPVTFDIDDRPSSYFFEMAIRFGERTEWIGGSRALASPEDALMRAALTLLAGGSEAEARMPAENDDSVLALRALPWREFPYDGGPAGRACELIWRELDLRTCAVLESRWLGVAASVLQLAEAALALGEAQARRSGPSAALIALAAALPAVRAAAPER